MNDPIEFQLSVQDAQAGKEELQLILQTLARELENQAAEVEQAVPTDAPSEAEMVKKGEPSSGIVDVKINLDALKTFGQWLYGRLVGTTTKVKFEYGEVKFEFEGRNDGDRATAWQDFEDFITKLEAAKQAKHG